MIICNLKGGLGNMLFQIAATISISKDNDLSCCFPNLNEHITYLNNENTYNPKLNYGLDYLKLFKKLNTCNLQGSPKIARYPFHFIEYPKLSENTLIDGFFQSEKYFKHNRNLILEILDFESVIDENINNKYSFLDKKTTSIHIRRGDYVNYPNHHPVLPIEYYENSIKLLEKETEIFVIFSDDIEWCKSHFTQKNIIFIEDEKDYNELYLMSLCNNNIISNSSFSWWGAWLNQNENKTVIGPIRWFGPSIDHDTSDILPNEWLKI